MLSFSHQVKNELTRISAASGCCAEGECYGILLLCNTFSSGEIKIITSHEGFSERIPKLFLEAFGITIDNAVLSRGGKKFIVTIAEQEFIKRIRKKYGYRPEDETVLRLNRAVLEQDCCIASFWRGAFLAGGTIAAPEAKYSIEITTPHRVLSRELGALLSECSLKFSTRERTGVVVLSLKSSEAIEDFLTLTGAPIASLAVMQAKVEKEIRNVVNRRVNCDTANLDKQLAASERLRGVIEKLEVSGGIEKLSDELITTARARIEYQEDSLSQLAQRLGISKSCLNHRLRKLTKQGLK